MNTTYAHKRYETWPRLPARFGRTLLFGAIVFYFLFHIFNGDRGLYAYIQKSRTLEAQRAQLAALSEQRKSLENRVHLMRDVSLNLDMLDEQARNILGASRKSEVVIIDPQPKNE